MPHSLDDLLAIMRRLRDPVTGCPWDQKQDFTTIVPSTLEEVYEAVDAIERADYAHLREELGDLLFQIVFYAQLAKEQSLFDMHGIIDAISTKLLARHPHVFPDGTLASYRKGDEQHDDESLKANWEALKQLEREGKGNTGVLADVPLALPALQRAFKLQKRMALVGFDWDTPQAVIAKIDEELDELAAADAEGDRDHIAEELGDLLFGCVNLCRHYGADPETVLRHCNTKVSRRFAYIEKRLQAQGKTPATATLDEMEALWTEAKSMSGQMGDNKG